MTQFSFQEKELSPGLFWLLEQIPGYFRREDLTPVLQTKTFWPSYNSPYFTGYTRGLSLETRRGNCLDVFNKSGNAELVEKLGDWFSYDKVTWQEKGTSPPNLNENISRLQELWSLIEMPRKWLIYSPWWDWWGNQLVKQNLKAKPETSEDTTITLKIPSPSVTAHLPIVEKMPYQRGVILTREMEHIRFLPLVTGNL